MSLEKELYDDYKKKVKRRSFFRGFLISSIFFSILLALYFFFNNNFSNPHIAHFEIKGVIFDDDERNNLLTDLAYDDNVKAVILKVDSPGGTVVGAESLYHNIRKIAEKKPLVVTMGEIAASGGYIAALASDFIIARENTLTGSIGVIGNYPNISELAKKIGITLDTIKSNDAKGGPSPFKNMTKNQVELEKILINRSYEWFKNLVATRRKMSSVQLEKVVKGNLFTGGMALDLGLIDDIGGNEQAIKYFESVDKNLVDLSILNWEMDMSSLPFWSNFLPVNKLKQQLSYFYVDQGPKLYSIVR